MEQEVPISLSRPFLAIVRVIVDFDHGEMKFRVNEGEVSFQVVKIGKQPIELRVVLVICVEDDEVKNRSLEDPT